MKSAFADRIRILIDAKKLSQRGFAEAIGANEARVSQWISGQTKNPRRTTLQKIAITFGCDLEWLATGLGIPFPTHGDSTSGQTRPTHCVTTRPEEVASTSHSSKTVNLTQEQEEFTVREMVNMTMEVLESDTDYKSALASCVRAFHKATRQEGEMKSVQEDIAEMRERMERMEQMLLSLGATPEKRDKAANS